MTDIVDIQKKLFDFGFSRPEIRELSIVVTAAKFSRGDWGKEECDKQTARWVVPDKNIKPLRNLTKYQTLELVQLCLDFGFTNGETAIFVQHVRVVASLINIVHHFALRGAQPCHITTQKFALN